MSHKNVPNLGDRPAKPAPGSDPNQTQPGAPFQGGPPESPDIFPDQPAGPAGGHHVRTPPGDAAPVTPLGGAPKKG